MTPESIRQLRKDLGMTQQEFATFLRLHPVTGGRTIRDWENGNRPVSGPASLALELLQRFGSCYKENITQ